MYCNESKSHHKRALHHTLEPAAMNGSLVKVNLPYISVQMYFEAAVIAFKGMWSDRYDVSPEHNSLLFASSRVHLPIPIMIQSDETSYNHPSPMLASKSILLEKVKGLKSTLFRISLPPPPIQIRNTRCSYKTGGFRACSPSHHHCQQSTQPPSPASALSRNLP